MKKVYSLLVLLGLFFTSYGQILTSAGSMNNLRLGHRSELLPDGKVLTFGGDDFYVMDLTVHKSSEIYDPATKRWTAGPDMFTVRTDHSSAVLPNGNILAIGGSDAELNGTHYCEIFNASENRWEKADSMETARYNFPSVVLNDGKVLVAGAIMYTDRSAEIYDPETGTWSLTDSTVRKHTDGASMVKLQDGKVLITGGLGTSGSTSAEIYDPETGEWELLENEMIGSRAFHSSVLLKNGKVLISGGTGFSVQKTAELFDPETKTFTSTGDLLDNCGGNPTILLRNGDPVVFSIGDMFSFNNTNRFQKYNVRTGEWLSLNGSGFGTQGNTVTKLKDGNILIVGGYFTTGNGASNGSWLVTDNTSINPDPDPTPDPNAIVESFSNHYSVYPNPASSSFNIKSVSSYSFEGSRFKLVDSKGTEVLNRELKQGEEMVDISNLSTGVYHLIITDNTGRALSTNIVVK